MILVDTSVWVDHLRYGDQCLEQLLMLDQVSIHPLVIGELACGNLQHREKLLRLWKQLPYAIEANHQEVMILLEQYNLMGKGIGFINLHLLATTYLTMITKLWTRDKRLHKISPTLGVAYLE